MTPDYSKRRRLLSVDGLGCIWISKLTVSAVADEGQRIFFFFYDWDSIIRRRLGNMKIDSQKHVTARDLEKGGGEFPLLPSPELDTVQSYPTFHRRTGTQDENRLYTEMI